MSSEPQPPGSADLRRPLLLLGPLGLGSLLLLFANGRNAVALLAWLAPIGLLRFTRSSRGVSGFAAILVIWVLAWRFQFRGMVPLPEWGVWMVASVYGALGAFPYAIDRWFWRRARGFSATLVFPSAVVLMEFGATSLTPYGSWGATAYSQYGDTALLQLASVTGLYGISFLVAWLAPVANWTWENGFGWQRVRSGILTFGCVLVMVFGAGELRLARSRTAGDRTRIASITAGSETVFPSGDAQWRFLTHHPLEPAVLEAIHSAMMRRNDDLLARTKVEAAAGAKLILWSEGAGQLDPGNEADIITRASAIARENGSYIALAALRYDGTRARPIQNKMIVIGPDGRVLSEYLKGRPVPGYESALLETTGTPAALVATPLGRIALQICFDLDFPAYVRRATRDGADLVIAPSSDWREVDPLHTHMAVFRAVENGFNLVRATAAGRSIAVDYVGRELAQVDDFASPGAALHAELPKQAKHTLYARCGDVFAWACIGGLIISATLASAKLNFRWASDTLRQA